MVSKYLGICTEKDKNTDDQKYSKSCFHILVFGSRSVQNLSYFICKNESKSNQDLLEDVFLNFEVLQDVQLETILTCS